MERSKKANVVSSGEALRCTEMDLTVEIEIHEMGFGFLWI